MSVRLSAALLLPLALALPARAQDSTAVPLQAVRVVARTSPAAQATRSVQVIDAEQLARHAGRSLAELLAFAVGADVQTRSPAQADLSLRGSTFNQVVVLVDGVRVSDVQSGHYALDLAVPTAMIERIEILRGGGSALYGSDAVGGIVNIVTRAGERGASASARGGSFGGASASGVVSAPLRGAALSVGADVDRSDGHRPGTDYRVAQARVAAERETRAGRLVAEVGQGVRRFGAADFYSPYPSEETTRSSTAALRLVPRDDARVAVAGSLHARRHHDLFTLKRDDPAFYQNEHLSHETGGELVARTALAPRAVAALGADLLDARLRSARLGDHAQTRGGAFGQLTLGRAEAAVLDLGVRGDWVTDLQAFVSPSVGVAFAVAPAAQLRASSSRGFRAPTWTERFYRDPANVADSTLAVERFWSHEVGLRATLFRRLGADVAVYERRASNLIDWARPAGATATTPWRTQNFASAVYRGIEASLSVPALLGVDWTVHGSGLRLDASAAPGTTGKYALRPVTRSAGVSGALRLPWESGFTADVLRARRTGEADHVQVNARYVAPVRDLRLSIEGVNLTGADYLDAAGKPVAGRSLYAGVSWSAR